MSASHRRIAEKVRGTPRLTHATSSKTMLLRPTFKPVTARDIVTAYRFFLAGFFCVFPACFADFACGAWLVFAAAFLSGGGGAACFPFAGGAGGCLPLPAGAAPGAVVETMAGSPFLPFFPLPFTSGTTGAGGASALRPRFTGGGGGGGGGGGSNCLRNFLSSLFERWSMSM